MAYYGSLTESASPFAPAVKTGAWCRLSFSATFHILSGSQALAKFIRMNAPDNLMDLFHEEDRHNLAEAASNLRTRDIKGVLFRTRHGLNLELLITRQGRNFKAYYRDADALVETTERLELFFKNFLNTPMAVCVTDHLGNITDVNDSFLRLYGYERSEVIGKNPRILKSGRQSPAAYKALWKSISDRTVGSWTGELINRTANGTEVYILLTISSVTRPNGSLIGYVGSAMDITKRKKMELELETRNRELEQLNRFKSDMMSITSHDLKAPLNAMISYADLMRENLGSLSSDKMTNYLGRISEYGTQLTRFIGDLLDLTKIESGKFQLLTNRARLDSVLQGCIDINQAHSITKGVRISYYREGKTRTSVVDVMRMSQVFNNILSNAVKFSPDGGVITVAYRDLGGDSIAVIIEDQGTGIPEEDLNAIFDQYYQVSREGYVPKRAFGAGIGLSVVKTIVELHKGTVRAENIEGKGCRFTVEVPIKTLTSLSSMAALIYDPLALIFPYIERPARSHKMDCFTSLTFKEAQRILDFENPDILFVSGASLSPDTLLFLKTVKQDNPHLYLVKIHDETADHDKLFFTTLQPPVTDTEMGSLMQGILQDAQRHESP